MASLGSYWREAIDTSQAGEICSTDHGTFEVLVGRINTGVDNRNTNPGTPGDLPGLLNPVVLEPILALPHLVGESGARLEYAARDTQQCTYQRQRENPR